MTTRNLELDLNETGFLCNMIVQSAISAGLTDGENIMLPPWLATLFNKLSAANDEMMKESPPAEKSSIILLN